MPKPIPARRADALANNADLAKDAGRDPRAGALSIVYRATADLIPYARNSRTHSDEQVGQIAASIREFGWTNPVLVDEAGTVIAGHGRLLAAHRLKMAEVPTIKLAGLSDTKRRALIIADNKLALNAGWDDQMLSLELADLMEDGLDMSLLGFSDDEIAALLTTANEIAMPSLADGDREPFQQMTFTLHDEQVEQVKAAMDRAKQSGPFDSQNENSNGNALARICESFLA